MKTVLLTVDDETAAGLLRRHGGQHVNPTTGEILQDVPAPVVRVDIRAAPHPDGVVRVRELAR